MPNLLKLSYIEYIYIHINETQTHTHIHTFKHTNTNVEISACFTEGESRCASSFDVDFHNCSLHSVTSVTRYRGVSNGKGFPWHGMECITFSRVYLLSKNQYREGARAIFKRFVLYHLKGASRTRSRSRRHRYAAQKNSEKGQIVKSCVEKRGIGKSSSLLFSYKLSHKPHNAMPMPLHTNNAHIRLETDSSQRVDVL